MYDYSKMFDGKISDHNVMEPVVEAPATEEIEAVEDVTEAPVEEHQNADQDTEDLTGHVANCNQVYLRENPDMGNGQKWVLDAGVELFITDEVNEWYEVVLADGREGYIKKEFVAIDE